MGQRGGTPRASRGETDHPCDSGSTFDSEKAEERKTSDDNQTASDQVRPKLADVLVPGQTGLALRRVSSESVFVQKSANQSMAQRKRALSIGIGQGTDSSERLSAVEERLQRMEGMLSQLLVASMDPAAKKGP